MKPQNIVAVALCTAILTTILMSPLFAKSEEEVLVPKLSHAQMVWSYALEYCESRGNKDAINPKDLDGTPSLGAMQFKPSTLVYFADKYNVAISTSTMDYDSQRAVLEQMILHKDEIKWSQQFPWCVKKLGPPPN